MTQYDLATLQRLSYRRQFILGPRFADGFPSWRRIPLSGTLFLTVHPDLDACRVARDDKWIALLGYILDPSQPAAGNEDILRGLLDTFHACADLPEQTDRFGGRYLLVAHDGVRTVLFADAAGLRQVVYTTGSAAGQLWCASQTPLLAEVVDLPLDAEALAFVQPDDPQSGNRMIWLPGDATLHAGIKLLLPNHYLDLGTGRPIRYWPTANLPVVPLRAAVTASSEILGGLVESAGRRFDVMLAMTAGWDSRLTLAAARSVAQRAFLYTAVFRYTAEGASDVTTPASLLSKLGLQHHILDCRHEVDDEFAGIYRRNVAPVHDQYAPVAQALLDRTPREGVRTTGDVGEVAKCVYRVGPSSNRDVTARDLAVLTRLPPHRFVLSAFESWLSEARAHCCNVPLMDLFYWEQEAGRLQGMIQAECEIARESFAPLNCRRLLATMLSVPEPFRQEPVFEFFRLIMERLWPDVLLVPINGQPQVGTEAVLRRTLENLRLLRLVPKPVKGLAKMLIRGLRTP